MTGLQIAADSIERLVSRDHKERLAALYEVAALINGAASDDEASPIIEAILERCVSPRHDYGLDAATDVFAMAGERAMFFAAAFILTDSNRWTKDERLSHHPNDDMIYCLLRGVCQSGVSSERKIRLASSCLEFGNHSIRDAAIWALGDVDTAEAYAVVESIGLADKSLGVRESAKLVLEDREG